MSEKMIRGAERSDTVEKVIQMGWVLFALSPFTIY